MYSNGDVVVLKVSGDPVIIISYIEEQESYLVRRPNPGQNGVAYECQDFFTFELCTFEEYLTRKIEEALIQRKFQKLVTGTEDVAQQL
jgi:hypothetical protein